MSHPAGPTSIIVNSTAVMNIIYCYIIICIKVINKTHSMSFMITAQFVISLLVVITTILIICYIMSSSWAMSKKLKMKLIPPALRTSKSSIRSIIVCCTSLIYVWKNYNTKSGGYCRSVCSKRWLMRRYNTTISVYSMRCTVFCIIPSKKIIRSIRLYLKLRSPCSLKKNMSIICCASV